MDSPGSQAKLTRIFRVAKPVQPVKREKIAKRELVNPVQAVKAEQLAIPVLAVKVERLAVPVLAVKVEQLVNPVQAVKVERLAELEDARALMPLVSHGLQCGGQGSWREGSSNSLLCRAMDTLTQTKQSDPPDDRRGAPRVSGAALVPLLRVKKELLSPISCLTDEGATVLAEVKAENPSRKSVADMQSVAAAHANLTGSNNASTRAPDAAALGSSSLPKLPEEASMTAMVMTQESSAILDTAVDVSVVKIEVAEPALEKRITALDMLPGGRPPAHASGAVSESPRSALEAPSSKPMTASQKPSSKDGLLHVKSEPVGASGHVSELEKVQQRIRRNQDTALNSHLRERRHTAMEESQAAAAAALEMPDEGCSQFPKTCAQNSKIGAGAPDRSGFRTNNSQDFRIHPREDPLVSQPAKLLNGMAAPFPHKSASDSGSISSEDGDDADEGMAWRSWRGSQTSQSEVKPRNSNPGRRIQGGRVYDSAFGRTCHWCRQKTVEPHVKCRACTIYYCGACLMNRNGENIRDELCDGVKWLCPKCRNGCGPGCENCCNCGPCRKALGKLPTGQMVSVARKAGFKNAHDYLVHLETGESPRRIARRKVGKGWTNGGRFVSEAASESDDKDGEYSEEEFTLNEETSTQLHQGKLDMRLLRRFVQSQKRKRVTMRPPPARKIPRPTSYSALASMVALEERVAEKRDDDPSIRRNRESSGATPMAVKREHEECIPASENGSKRRKTEGFYDLSFSRSFNEVKCKIEPNTFSKESEAPSKMRGASTSNGGGGGINASMECPVNPQGIDYRSKLKSVLAQPFSADEMETLDCLIRCRKPMQKLRQMRGRVVDVVTEEEGLSYLDHHHDFAAKFEVADSQSEKLALLRGFFFWLQHACMEGSFKPWPSSQAQARRRSGDCIETEGPDCQVTAVVLQLDESCNEANPHVKRKSTHPPPGEIHGPQSASRQSVLPFPAKKTAAHPAAKPRMRAQLAAAPAMNRRVVFGLCAPALSEANYQQPP